MNGPTSAMAAHTPESRLELSTLQHAWLTEIGLERRLLGHYVPAPARGVTIQPQPQPVAKHNDMPDVVPDDMNRSRDLAMAALKQAGGLRRVAPPASIVPDALQPKLDPSGTAPSVSMHELPSDWAALQAHAEACQACSLHSERDQLVFGMGDTQQPDWLIVGEAPGKADDRTGQPFQGKAGTLLHAMLVAAGVHSASAVLGGRAQPVPAWSHPVSMYFSNLIKCRPLGNRSPDAAEAAACMPYLKQQIELLQPTRILALGKLAAQALLSVEDEVEDLRGRVHHVTTTAGIQIPVVVTWHPAALLMHPQNKGQAWADLNLAKRL